MSLSLLNRSFNTVVYVDYFFLDGQPVIHVMDSSSRYSSGALVADTSKINSIRINDEHCIIPFWSPETNIYDQAFNMDAFRAFMCPRDIAGRQIAPRRHEKNMLESKHRVLRDIYLRLKENSCEYTPSDESLLIQQWFRI